MRRSRTSILIVWLASIGVVLLDRVVDAALADSLWDLPLLDGLAAISLLLFIGITVIGLALAVRYVLRRLFWRVGRRLVLSYFLIGVLPFIFFAILMTVIGYLVAGVLSQAAFRNERQVTLSRLDQWNLEYSLTGSKPASALPSLEIYDSRDGTIRNAPEWLRYTSFVGLAHRDRTALFVSSRVYEKDGGRETVIFAQPIDAAWSESLSQRNGMIITGVITEKKSRRTSVSKGPVSIGVTPMQREPEVDVDVDLPDDDFDDFFARVWRRPAVVWFDYTPPLARWADGETDDETFLLTFLSNPWKNIFAFYFGSSQYLNAVLGVIAAVASLQALVYLLAVILAAGLIFSISRAVNRIERGTKAVERGDFSYRIRMKPHNQLGEVAQSFDRMTESIADLLTRVAEQERLQSEIDIAASIQRNLLPSRGPDFSGISFSAHFEPTASIGGDYYDVFNLSPTRLAVTIGDVSGHGLSTGLVMAMVKAAITTLIDEGVEERAIFRRLNELVLHSTDKRAFMTLGFTTFDLERKVARHTNSGHLYPYLLRKGSQPHPLEVPSLPLGLRADIEPKTIEIALRDGDTLVYLSDGIIEAQNDDGDPFGFEQLEAVLSRLDSHPPAEVQRKLLDELALHTGDHPADDDRTLMVLRFDRLSVDVQNDEVNANASPAPVPEEMLQEGSW